METNPRKIQEELLRPFAPEDLEWRLQRTLADQGRGIAVPYVTNRAIQERLDDVVGAESWRNEFTPWHNGKKSSQICGISIYFEGRGWVTKWDGAENTDVEPVKGGLSDAMKRAAVQFGIGRALYKMNTVWVDVEQKGKSWFIRNSELPKLNRAYLDTLEKLHLTPAAPGGTQAQLTPFDDGEQPAVQENPPKPERQPEQAPPPDAPIGKTLPFPGTQEPDYAYTVQSVKVQPGMNGASTYVVLADRDGNRKNTYARGERADLYTNARLKNVKLCQKQQDTVVFYVLESYELVGPAQQAS